MRCALCVVKSYGLCVVKVMDYGCLIISTPNISTFRVSAALAISGPKGLLSLNC